MKALTHEEWMKNPTPRMMWVWDDDEAYKKQMKVIYIAEQAMPYPVVVVDDNETSESRYKGCAEIGKQEQRRMTNKELSRWLRENPTREYVYENGNYIYNYHDYGIIHENEEVSKYIKIRENDGEWREPLVEEDNTLWD